MATATGGKSAPAFTWIAFYEALANRLRDYSSPAKQLELIALLERLRKDGLPITPLEDRDATGRHFLLEQIDPFTFFGTFNRGITKDRRIQILREFRKFFGLTVEVPSDFDGIPVLNNMKSWFFPYSYERDPNDIPSLWAVFESALNPDALNSSTLAPAFDRALEVKNTNVNLTMGLFWIRPNVFASLDGTLREHLKIRLPGSGLAYTFYRKALENVRAAAGKRTLAEVSFAAWEGEPHSTATTHPAPDIEYWLVGAYWDSFDPPDQTERFLAEGIWVNGYKDRHLDDVKAMKPGDRIAIKAATTQRQGLPFDNAGKTVSRMVIKARGTIVRNRGDGRTIEVEWESDVKTRDWYFYTARPTVWHLRKEKDLAQRLIKFVFADAPQDYEYFSKETRASASNKASEPLVMGDASEPYSLEDAVAEGVFLPESELRTALSRLQSKKALVLQGAPGVGKTFLARKLAYALMQARDDSRVTLVQFHPSFSYEDFVRGYRPTGEAGKFELKDGAFFRLCEQAKADPDREHVLIIDEINRGHLSEIFGELFMLLESDKRGPEWELTPIYRKTDDERFFVPDNVYLIGTMNIADRSLALVDFALRRRFAFLSILPAFKGIAFQHWLTERKMPATLVQLIVQRMTALNDQIASDSRLGRTFEIGHSFFCPRGDDFTGLGVDWFRDIVTTEIIPLIEEYWHDAPEKVESARNKLLA